MPPVLRWEKERKKEMKDPKNELDELREKEKLQKSSAKFWGIVITAILVIAIVWAVASHLM